MKKKNEKNAKKDIGPIEAPLLSFFIYLSLFILNDCNWELPSTSSFVLETL